MSIPQQRIVITGLDPVVEGGRFEVKAVLGDRISVSADVFKDGHDQLRAEILYRPLAPGERSPFMRAREPVLSTDARWRHAPLIEGVNDRWHGHFVVDAVGGWVYAIVAWTDRFVSWRDALRKKYLAGQDVEVELLQGMRIVEDALRAAGGEDAQELSRLLAALDKSQEPRHRVDLALHPRLAEVMRRVDPGRDAAMSDVEVPLWVDRPRARTGAWYEMFPRSQGSTPGQATTLRQAEARLPDIASMGFDVVYLPPVHPIGLSHRKGKNNNPVCTPGEPGSPWAIGSEQGGHDAVHPELGTLEDFDHFVAASERLGMEIALDVALQCSPDHPWVKQHPQWFAHRPDGSIQYAENPPKKYQDIYPLDFETEDRDGLYGAVLGVFEHWIAHGVKIFRVDNPHTKAFSFWEWLIATVHHKSPDVVFLAEAFTRPKRMYRLAKLGFSQSYSYFTWRNSRDELESYAHELFCTEVRHFYRPNFFANTPDILHAYLQHGGRPAFVTRAILAATLSPSYGIYSGFELCENTPLCEGSEEYLDSEKYEIKVRDWNAPGNIKALLRRINQIRRQHPALTGPCNFRRLASSNPAIMAYAKVSTDGSDVLIVVVNLDPHHVHEGQICIEGDLHRGDGGHRYSVVDLLDDQTYDWVGDSNYVRLEPGLRPAHLLALA